MLEKYIIWVREKPTFVLEYCGYDASTLSRAQVKIETLYIQCLSSILIN